MKILLIEDDLDDIELLEDAMKEEGTPFTLSVINDGNAALQYVRTSSDYPDIIILDFNLPKIHGREILRDIKSNSQFNMIPLVILTTSSAKEDMEYAYSHGADKYLIKPGTLVEIKRIVESIVSLAKSPS